MFPFAPRPLFRPLGPAVACPLAAALSWGAGSLEVQGARVALCHRGLAERPGGDGPRAAGSRGLVQGRRGALERRLWGPEQRAFPESLGLRMVRAGTWCSVGNPDPRRFCRDGGRVRGVGAWWLVARESRSGRQGWR